MRMKFNAYLEEHDYELTLEGNTYETVAEDAVAQFEQSGADYPVAGGGTAVVLVSVKGSEVTRRFEVRGEMVPVYYAREVPA